ncbi:MAG: Lipopolysaccharide heptosyltransferase II [Bacteroidetes bacterium]|nr:Lipopolysaccharide heptosyltransferase II [Bacteroidota bacterium]
MNTRYKNILVIQTAFIGDAVLTLPLVQVLKKHFRDAELDIVVVPRSAQLFRNHPSLHRVVEYDKRGKDSGLSGFLRMVQSLKSTSYQLAVIPHRSIRSSLLAKLAGIPTRVGFDRSSGRMFLTNIVRYRNELHEIDRNISLLEGLGQKHESRELPAIYPSRNDSKHVEKLLSAHGFARSQRLIALAPGTIWNTKRWMIERFADLGKRLVANGFRVVLIGGPEDKSLCDKLVASVRSSNILNTAGEISLLQSAELLSRCRVLVSNDSAPMHIAVAMRTPVVAIFGATVPSFGFAPYGEHDVVVETTGLSCRPCSIHGGEKCPIGTFDCMNNITADRVEGEVRNLLKARKGVH